MIQPPKPKNPQIPLLPLPIPLPRLSPRQIPPNLARRHDQIPSTQHHNHPPPPRQILLKQHNLIPEKPPRERVRDQCILTREVVQHPLVRGARGATREIVRHGREVQEEDDRVHQDRSVYSWGEGRVEEERGGECCAVGVRDEGYGCVGVGGEDEEDFCFEGGKGGGRGGEAGAYLRDVDCDDADLSRGGGRKGEVGEEGGMGVGADADAVEKEDWVVVGGGVWAVPVADVFGGAFSWGEGVEAEGEGEEGREVPGCVEVEVVGEEVDAREGFHYTDDLREISEDYDGWMR